LARFLFSRPASLRAWCRCFLLLGIDAGSKGIHQIDHPRRWGTPDWRDLFTGFFLFEQVNKGILVVIFEVRRIEVPRLVADDMTCKVERSWKTGFS
jgi:hypothetical protein